MFGETSFQTISHSDYEASFDFVESNHSDRIQARFLSNTVTIVLIPLIALVLFGCAGSPNKSSSDSSQELSKATDSPTPSAANEADDAQTIQNGQDSSAVVNDALEELGWITYDDEEMTFKAMFPSTPKTSNTESSGTILKTYKAMSDVGVFEILHFSPTTKGDIPTDEAKRQFLKSMIDLETSADDVVETGASTEAQDAEYDSAGFLRGSLIVNKQFDSGAKYIRTVLLYVGDYHSFIIAANSNDSVQALGFLASFSPTAL